MNKAYTKLTFVNNQAPDLDAENLNSISNAIDTIDDRVVAQDTSIASKANKNAPTFSGNVTIDNGDLLLAESVGSAATVTPLKVWMSEVDDDISSAKTDITSLQTSKANKSYVDDELDGKLDSTNPTSTGTLDHSGKADFGSDVEIWGRFLTQGDARIGGKLEVDEIAVAEETAITVKGKLNLGYYDIASSDYPNGVIKQVKNNTSRISTLSGDIGSISRRSKENRLLIDMMDGYIGSLNNSYTVEPTIVRNKVLYPNGVTYDADYCDIYYYALNGDNIYIERVDLAGLDGTPAVGYAFLDDNGNEVDEGDNEISITIDDDGDHIYDAKAYVPSGATKIAFNVMKNSTPSVYFEGSVAEAIEELKNKPSGISLTSASPLQSSTASSIVGIDACGNSTQSGTPTPTNPISIVDASGDVTAINPITDFKDAQIGKAWNYTNNANRALFEIDVEPSKAYKIDLSKVVDSNIASVSVIQKVGRVSSLIEGKTTNTTIGSSITITTDATCNVICIQLSTTSACTTTDTTAMQNALMYTASNKITLPTLRSIPYSPIKDELIVNADGSGQIIRRVGIGNLASLNWRYDANNKVFVTEDDIGALKIVDITMACDRYKAVVNSGIGFVYAKGNNVICGYEAEPYNRVYIRDDRTTNATDFKALLSGADFRYALKTPTTTTLTASEVSAIRQLQTYSGTTIIDSALDVQSVTYHADTKQYIDGRTDYSYSDTVIGKWADGKDLHRMVISTTTPNASSAVKVISNVVNSTNHNIKRIDGTLVENTNIIAIPFIFSTSLFGTMWVNPNGINMLVSSNDYINKPCEIIVEYTLNDEATQSDDGIAVLSEGGDE